jgi:tetratricopeptide (TPR) repeat protein
MALETNLAWLKEHTRLGELARRWEERDRNSTFLLRGRDLEDAQRWIALHPRGAPEPTTLHRQFVVQSRRSVVRRQRALIAGSLMLAIMGFGLAGLALWQRQQALEQSSRANQNFAAAKAAADGLINDLAKNLRNVRGVSQETTRTLLTAANGVMDKLVATTAPTPELELSQFELHYQFGLTYWFVGDVTNALSSIRRSLAITDRMLIGSTDPNLSNKIMAFRYDALIEQGNILRVLGQLDASLESFQKAWETAKSLVHAVGDADKQAALKLAKAHGRIGDVMRSSRRFEEADANYRAAERIQLRFLATTPDDQDWMLELSWSYNRLADNLLRITNHEGLMTVAVDRTAALRTNPNLSEASAYYANSVLLRQQLMATRGQDARNFRDVIWSLTMHGMATLASDTPKALTILESALQQVNQALEIDPKNTELLRYQANAYNFRGDGYLISGDISAAFADYERGLRVRQSLSDTDPTNARWLRDLFYTLRRMVELHQIAGDKSAEYSYRTQASEVGERVSLRFPRDHVLATAVHELKSTKPVDLSAGIVAPAANAAQNGPP